MVFAEHDGYGFDMGGVGGVIFTGEVLGENESSVGVAEGGECAPAASLGITSAVGGGGGGLVVGGFFCVMCRSLCKRYMLVGGARVSARSVLCARFLLSE